MAFDLDDEENEATRKMNGASKESRDKNMDIEVGEYVKTRAGHFYKITRIDENGLIYWNKIQCGWSMEQLKDIVVKHSKQLIDLIEVKDVIKYRIDNISTTLETKGYVEGIVDISDEEMLQRIKNDNNYHILEILTKESYMANCYKVGGEQVV